MRKVIKHLTYAETAEANTSGHEMPRDIGNIFHFPDYYSVIGQRLALLLAEDKVRISESERIVIVFSDYLRLDEIKVTERSGRQEATYINIGVNKDEINGLTEEEKIDKLLQLTEKALLFVAENKAAEESIRKSISLLREKGEMIELPYQTKSDQHATASVTMTIQNDGQCQLYLTVQNQDDETLLRTNLRNTHCFSVADQLCGSLLLRKSKVIIKPQKNIGSRNFEPIEIEYSQV